MIKWSIPLNAFNQRRLVYYRLIKAKTIYYRCTVSKWVWGIDPSLTGTGFAALNTRTNTVFLDRLSTSRTLPLLDRTDLIVRWLSAKYRLFKPALIIMEKAFVPFSGTNGRATVRISHAVDLNKLNHAIEYGLYLMGGALYRNTAARPVKKYISGNTNASKAEVQEAIVNHHGAQINNEDMNDAFSMGVLASGLLRLILSFNLKKFDYNDSKSMLAFQKALVASFNQKYEGEVIFNMLAAPDPDNNLCRMVPPTKCVVINRKHTLAEVHGIT